MIQIDLQIALFISGIIIAAIGWQFKRHDARIESAEKDIDALRLTVANEYSKKEEVLRIEHAILNKLDRMEAKQDNLFIEVAKKQDRP